MMKRISWLYCLAAMAVLLLMVPAATAENAVQAGSTQFLVTNYNYLPGLQAVVPTAGNQFLLVNLVVKTAADAKELSNPEDLLLAVDGKGCAYTPALYNGTSSFTASLQPGEKVLTVLFEIPDSAGSYRLAVLSEAGGNVTGTIGLGDSIGPAMPGEDGAMATVEGKGYTAVIHSAVQSAKAFVDEAPEGMKYVWVDATFTGSGTEIPVSRLAAQWMPGGDGQAAVSAVPTRADNLLSLMNVRLSDQMPSIRGKLCYLVPADWTELTGLTADGTALGSLPISGELQKARLAMLGADNAYHQADWKITVRGIRLSNKGDLANPPDGSKYVVVSLTIANESTQNLTVSSELAFAMTDANGNELTQAWFADLSEPLDAVLLPSESVSGDVAFLLPDGMQANILRVHLNMMGEPLLIDAASYLK